MARDLVTAVGISPDASVLDVGTGTGLVADLVRGVVGSSGFIVGIDPSLEMLKIARGRRQIVITAAMVPGLPFEDASFDAVVANLVISHLRNLRGAC
jgi:ubiquinone/menaquinone biosynthesis C-methylase UbiE